MTTRQKGKRSAEGPESEEDKEHSGWFYERAAFPLRDAALDDLEDACKRLSQQRRKQPKRHRAAWESAGPFNIAGRVTSLVVSASDTTHLIAGSAGGGVWRSTNGGKTWDPCDWPQCASQSIGALAAHPTYPEIVFAATGEANLSPDTYPGTGFYISLNFGKTWAAFHASHSKGMRKDERASIPRRVGTIAFDPFNKLHGAVGGVALDERSQAGLYMLEPGENGCARLVPANRLPLRPYNCHSVVYHPKTKGLIFAALELRGSENGIWRGTPKNWERLGIRNGLPAGESFGRTTIAISPSDPNIIYALAADRRRGILGIFRSADMGDNWKRILGPGTYESERFMHYNNTMVIHPDDPDFVIWGGQSLYRTKNAGESKAKNVIWTDITRSSRNARNPRNYVHEDHHALVMPKGNLVYSGNDGGVAVSEDGGENWDERSSQMVTTMFYDVDVAPTNCRILGGGAQDAGSLIGGVRLPKGGLKKGDFVQAFRGDGGWVVFDENDEEVVFGSRQNLQTFRHLPGEPWERWTPLTPKEIPVPERSQRAMAVLAMGPKKGKNSKRTVWAGTSRLWRTADDGNTWEPLVDKPFDGSVISAIEIATADPSIVFVGTSKGGIFRSRDGGETWSEDLAGVDIPRRVVTRIEAHPKDAEMVAVAVASTGLPGPLLIPTLREDRGHPFVEKKDTPFQKPWSNIFWTENGGETWLDVDGGLLPNVVFYALAFETREPYRLFVAGDAGVWVKLDSRRARLDRFGRKWRLPAIGWLSIKGNLPNVVVSDIVYNGKDQVLTAATYGRGIWRLRTDNLKTN